METLSIKQKAIALIESKLNKTATILDIRAWQPATIFEIDLYLPGTDMYKWKEAQHIKCRVAPFTYRDYTPAWWDADTHTCTLLIDAAHDGAGSRWVKTLQKGDLLHYMGVGASHQQTVKNARCILLGDQTAIAHFAALQQLTHNDTEIHGAVVIDQPNHRNEFAAYFPKLPLAAVAKEQNAVQGLLQWLNSFKLNMDDVFYLAGNSNMVAQVRTILKQQGFWGTQIKAQGFWK